jgi:hypothetical protein
MLNIGRHWYGRKAEVSRCLQERVCVWTRLMVIKRLQRIGEGQWDMDGGTEQRLSEVR